MIRGELRSSLSVECVTVYCDSSQIKFDLTQHQKRAAGFTLLEVAVVLVVIALVMVGGGAVAQRDPGCCPANDRTGQFAASTRRVVGVREAAAAFALSRHQWIGSRGKLSKW
ncbi:prepilin-type N-terminal cleavage/methylation domain-containing protein [Burkholderia seminalis]|uniref:prepilin-type N-terminal cleavage/methylation domain-containing protein n=1 Tax=Burkholderia seminalis TaxID=488731 RepID=UPI003464A833